ncbi:MAG: GIY-YIG nuclease family protein [Cyanobacteria bacterium J06635_13]
MWSIYMIRCGDRSLYTGISNNVPKRFSVHQSGSSKAAKYTRTRHPLKLVFTAEIGTKSAASQVEYRIKQLPKRTKERLAAGQISLFDLSFMQTIDCTSGIN